MRMPRSGTVALVSLGCGLALMIGLGTSSVSNLSGEVVDRKEVLVLREQVESQTTARDLVAESVGARLRRNGFEAGDVEIITNAIRQRLSAELEEYVDSLRGLRFGSMDDLHDAIRIRETILCHDAIARPRRFAGGRPLTFIVGQSDAEELLRSIDARIAFREVSLRDTLRELSARQRVTLADEYSVGTYSRMRAKTAARTAIQEMRGAPFFSKAEAGSYVGNAIDAELERILAAVRDRATRDAVLEKARSRDSTDS